MICQNCGADVAPADKFCGSCGKAVEIDQAEIKKCKGCSSLLKLAQKFCSVCGLEIDANVLICGGKTSDGQICREVLTVTSGYCNNCGTKQEMPDVLDGGGKTKDSSGSVIVTAPIDEVIHEKIDPPVHFGLRNSELNQPIQKRSLAVVCCHSKFTSNHDLAERRNAREDSEMMRKIWELYGCEVIESFDPRTSFYDEKLVPTIEAKLKDMPHIDYFVFVLSSHGEERVEVLLGKDEVKKIEHYFFTKDGQCSTQTLMDKISDIEKLQGKLKMFVIQACRSRYEMDNEERGVEIEVKVSQELSIKHTSQTEVYSGPDLPDARGMPPPEEDDSSSSSSIEDQENIWWIQSSEAYSVMKKSVADVIPEEDLPPLEIVPHCDDSVVIFASMAGKYAYKKVDAPDQGGWLIKSLHDKLNSCKPGESIHILEVLTEVNREVGQRESRVKRNELKIPTLNMISEGEKEQLQKILCQLQDFVREQIRKTDVRTKLEKFKTEVEILMENVNSVTHTSDSLRKLHSELEELSKKIRDEVEVVTLKAQSCYFHNLAFDESELFLVKQK